jgi:hypothetical protein
MAIKNPRVVGYIDPEDHAKLKAFMEQRELTESKAIAVIVNAFFGGTTKAQSNTPSRPDDVVDRIAALERQMEQVLGESLA